MIIIMQPVKGYLLLQAESRLQFIKYYVKSNYTLCYMDPSFSLINPNLNVLHEDFS